jgi:hypothetical protein
MCRARVPCAHKGGWRGRSRIAGRVSLTGGVDFFENSLGFLWCLLGEVQPNCLCPPGGHNNVMQQNTGHRLGFVYTFRWVIP